MLVTHTPEKGHFKPPVEKYVCIVSPRGGFAVASDELYILFYVPTQKHLSRAATRGLLLNGVWGVNFGWEGRKEVRARNCEPFVGDCGCIGIVSMSVINYLKFHFFMRWSIKIYILKKLEYNI